MVWVAALDGHGAIELLQQDEAAQFMGQGEAGQGQALGGGGQGRRVQSQMAADEEGEGAGFQFPLGDPGGEFLRSEFPSLGSEGDRVGPGRNLSLEPLALPDLDGCRSQAGGLFFFPDAFQGQVQEGLQALLIKGLALLDEGFPSLTHHEDGYVEHVCNSLVLRAAANGSSWRGTWRAIRFGTVLENVSIDSETRLLDFDSEEVTENTRAAYPLKFIGNAVIPSVGGHPNHVIFLTADAFGVLPPIAMLSPEQAMYHFLSGYTAKVAGTERGLGKEPQATFSACFGGPFLPRPAATYASLLGEKLRRHGAQCWLVNTGWAGGPFGVGERMKLRYTRAMLNAALNCQLQDAAVERHPVFGVAVPKACPGVPAQFLDARGMWPDKAAYDRAALDLAARFNKNFEKFRGVGTEIAAAAPGM